MYDIIKTLERIGMNTIAVNPFKHNEPWVK